jgi:hypothetical protein
MTSTSSSNSAILARAEEYRDLKAEISRLDDEAHRVAGELLAMLAARQETSVELDGGWKVARLTNTTTTYDFEAAKAAWRPSILRRVMIRAVDRKLVAAEIEAGRLTVLDAKAVATTTESAPYPRVTPPKKTQGAA